MEMQSHDRSAATATPGMMREMLAIALRALLSGIAVAMLAGVMIVGLVIVAG